MELCREVAEYKIETGKKVLDTEREKAKIEKISQLVKDNDNVHAIDDLFLQIMANSRKMQYRLLEKTSGTFVATKGFSFSFTFSFFTSFMGSSVHSAKFQSDAG